MSELLGFGTLMKRETAVADVYADLGNPINIVPPTRTRETVDTTTHKTPGRNRTFMGALRDAGEATLTILYDPGGTAHTDLNTDYNSDVPRGYQIVKTDGGTATFDALVTEVGEETPLADKVTVTAKFKLSGPIVWTDV